MSGTELRALTSELWATSPVVFVQDGRPVEVVATDVLQEFVPGTDPPKPAGPPRLVVTLGK